MIGGRRSGKSRRTSVDRPAVPSAPEQGGPTDSAPLVWPRVTRKIRGIPSLAGHTDTILDIAGRLGVPPSLVIFTEGNHLMVLHGEDILGAFPAWAKARPEYGDLALDNIVTVTLPQQICIQMIRTGAVALGDLTIEISRTSGFYPDIVMGYPEPLRQLRAQGVLEGRARFFCKNRGLALLVRTGNPFGIHSLADVVRTRARIALPDSGDVRIQCRAAADTLLGALAAEQFFGAEVPGFDGRLGIMHRDLPEMIARGYADVAFTWHHLVSYWTRTFPDHFAFVPIPGADAFFTQIAFGRVMNPLRPRAMTAFDEFFFGCAQDVYPKYDFALMSGAAYSAPIELD
jgi:molybdate transport system substrate-binding protein